MSTIDSTAANQAFTPDSNNSGNKSNGSDNFLSLLSIASVQITPDSGDLGPQITATPAPKVDNKPQTPAPKAERPAAPQAAAPERPALKQEAAPQREPAAPAADKPQASARDDAPKGTEKTAESKASEDNTPVKLTPKKSSDESTTQKTSDSSDKLREIQEEQSQLRKALDKQLAQIDLILSTLIDAFALRHYTQGHAAASQTVSIQYQSLTTTTLTQFGTEGFGQFTGTADIQGLAQADFTQFTAFTSVQYSYQATGFFSDQFCCQQTDTAQTLSALRNLQASLQQLRAALNSANLNLGDAKFATPAAAFSAQFTQTTITQLQTTVTTQAAPAANTLQEKLQALLAQLGANTNDNVQISATQKSAETADTQLPADSKPQPISFSRLFNALKEGLQHVRETIGQLREQHEATGEKLQNLLPQADTVLENADQLDVVFKTQSISFTQKTENSLPPFITSLGNLDDSLLGNNFGNQAQPTGQNNAQTLLAVLENNSQQQTGGQTGGNGQSGQQLLNAIGNSTTHTNGTNTQGDSNFARTLARSTPALVNDQVQIHVRNAIKAGASHINIQLDPEELGKLEIRLNVDANGKTGVTIIADNRQTLDLLQRDAAGLARALNDAGLSADSGSLNFNLRGGEQQQQQQGGNGKPSQYSNQQPEEDPVPVLINNTSSTDSHTGNGGLDIRI